MTASAPPGQTPRAAAISKTAIKLAYEVGDECWIFVGVTDRHGNPILCPGTVIFWFDLPNDASRQYVIRLRNPEWLMYETRDALLMAPSKDAGLPFQNTRKSDRIPPDPPPGGKEWRNS